jgi:hypothetical protein
VIHLHLKLVFQDRDADRSALADVLFAHGLRAAPLPPRAVAEPPTAFPHAAMFHGMFHTALAMAGCDDADGGAAAPPEADAPPEDAAPSPPPAGDDDSSEDDDFPEIKAPE